MATHFKGGQDAHDDRGFLKPEDFDPVKFETFHNQYQNVLKRREARWKNTLHDFGDGENLPDDFLNKRKLKRYVRKGIPPELRPKLWQTLSGSETQMKLFASEYKRLLDQTLPDDVQNAIGKDLNRTFPDNIYFSGTDPTLLADLKEILHAFANKNPHIGYCQGLNFVAAMILLIMKDEDKKNERSFWLLHKIVKDLPDFYAVGMKGLRIDMNVLGELVRKRAPDISKKFDQTTLRIWDCLFYEGSKILLRVGLTLILHNRSKLLAAQHGGDMVDVFKAMTSDQYVLECHKFIQDIFVLPGNLSSSEINQCREKCGHEL